VPALAVADAPDVPALPVTVVINLVGRPTHAFADAALRTALEGLLPPGTTLVVGTTTLPEPLEPGDVIAAPVVVHARLADGTPLDGALTAVLRVGPPAGGAAQTLLYSDDPEKFEAPGVLYTGTVVAGRPGRLYVYHLPSAKAAGEYLSVGLAVAAGTARVQIVGRAAGPNPEVMFVGQTASFRLLDNLARAAGVVVDVSAGRPVVLASFGPLAANALIAGSYDIAVLAGAPVEASVWATADPALGTGSLPAARPDGHGRIGRFSLEDPTRIDLSLASGDGPSPLATVGGRGEALPNLAGGRPLVGAYGVVSPIRLRLANATAAPQRFYFFEAPSGSPVTTTLRLDGDPGPTTVPCVRTAGNRYLVRTFVVAAHTAETVTGAYTTDGGSSYPLRFGLSFDVPYAPPASARLPDGCFPKPT